MNTIRLVVGYSLAHKDSCYSIKKARGIRVVAPELPEAEVVDFLKARKLDGCRSCLRKYLNA